MHTDIQVDRHDEATRGKMADEVWEQIASALSTIVTTTDKSGNLKKELKIAIAETVSTLRSLLAKLKSMSESKTKTISELETVVNKMKSQNKDEGLHADKGHAAPSLNGNQELACSRDRGQAVPSLIPSREPTVNRKQGDMPPGNNIGKLYSTVLKNKTQQQHFKITVKSKGNLTADAIKELLKAKINPTDIKVGINSLKTLTDGRVVITTSRKEEAEALENDIKEKCREELEPILHRWRNPRLIIRNTPEDITTKNIEETLIKQNPELYLQSGDIIPKFCYTTKKLTRNLVMEVNAQTRKSLMQRKIKLGWMVCKVEDYLVPNRCFKCSRYNHRQQDCRGEETCPLCAGRHKMKDCTVSPTDYKCINCSTYNLHNKNAQTCENHSTLDRNYPSLLALLDRNRQNIDY
jgi:hypothetical protein